jgi:PST family polysaccharide transporter
VAYNWAYFPFNQVYLPLINVAISGLSRAASDTEQYKRQSRQILMLMFGPTFRTLKCHTQVLTLQAFEFKSSNA